MELKEQQGLPGGRAVQVNPFNGIERASKLGLPASTVDGESIQWN